MFFKKDNLVNKELQKENEELKKTIEEYIKYKVNIEQVLQNIGKDFSKLSLIIENRDKNCLKEDLEKIEKLFINFEHLFRFAEFPEHEEKIKKANLIEQASYQILRNYQDRDNNFIKEVIEETKRK